MKTKKKPPAKPLPEKAKKKNPVASSTPAKPRKTVPKERPSDIRQVLSSMMDCVPHAILGLKKRKIIFANQNVKKVFGWEPEELVGKDSRILYRTDEEYLEISKRLYPALKKERVLMGEISLRHRDGSDRICFGSAARVGEELKDRMVVVTCEDVTERKNNEEALIRYREELEEKVRERTSRLQKEMLEHKITSEQAIAANERLRYLLGGTSAVVYAAKTSGDYGATFISDSVERLTGFKAHQFTVNSTFWINHVHPDDRHQVEGTVPKIFEQKASACEYRFQTKDGTYIWVRDEMRLIRDDRGQPLEIIGYWTDISDRKKIEEKLNKESFLLKEYFENMPLMAYHISFDGRIVDCNSVVLRTLGYDRKSDLIGKFLIDTVYAPASREKARTLLAKWKKEGVLKNEELQIITKRGEIRDILLNVDTVYDENTFPLYSLSTQIDITDRKQTEEALRTSEEKYRLLMENAGEAILIAQDGMMKYANPATAKILVYPDEVLTSKPFTDFLYPEDHSMIMENHVKRLRGDDVPEIYSFRVVASDGTVKWVENHAAVIEWEGKPASLNFISDITERKQAEDDLKQREQSLRSIFLAAPIGIGVVVNRVIKDVNDRLCEMVGYSKDELIGKSVRILYPTEEEFESAGLDKLSQIEKRGMGSVETSWVRKDGRTLGILLSSAPLTPGDLSAGVTFTAIDITEQKLAEAILRQSEEKFYRAFHANPSLMAIRSLKDGRFLDMNDTYTRVTGYSREELIGKTSIETGLSRADEYFKVRDLIRQHSSVRDLEVTLTTRTGEERSGLFSAEMVQIDGEPCLLSVLNDFTERKRAEESLRRSEHRLSELMNFLPDPTLAIDNNKRVILWNRAMEEMTGVSAQEMIGKGDYAYTVPFYGVARPQLMDLFWEPEHEIQARYPVLKKEGETLVIEVFCPALYSGKGAYVWAKATPLRDLQGNMIGAIEVIRDITDRKREQETLKESEERYRLLYENTPVGVCTYDTQLRIISCNDRYASILRTSKERVIGFDLHTMVDQGPLQAVLLSIEGKYGSYEGLYHTTTSGTDVWLRSHSAPLYDALGNIIGGMGIVEDISERKRLEAQLLQAQKMEAVGTLAGGIAHDFNNLLTGILGHTTMMVSGLQPNHPFYERLQGIEQFVQSGAGLTRQLLGFASKGMYDVKPTDINELVNRTAAMFGRTRKEIVLHRAFQADLWISEVDIAQMEQVLMNLFVNAWQAMPGGGGLYLETSNYSVGEEDAMRSFLAPGRYVKISVTDTGIGMDEKMVEKIFDPFFTTKEMGRGTGLGLAMVYGIIKSHGGHITVYSQAGRGSTFNIYLPASERDVVREAVAPRPELRRGTERILLVDDEQEIREVMTDILKLLGHDVLEAGDGETALELYRAHGDRIDLVILDMVMPGIGGGEVFDRLKSLNPDVRVLLSSGYSINGEAKSIMERGCEGFIQKPATIANLSQKIREIMKR